MSASFETLEERAEQIREPRVLEGHNDYVWGISFSPNGHLLASGSGDNAVRLWSVETGRPIRVFRRHSTNVLDISFSPDGRLLASASGALDRTMYLWEVETGRQIQVLEGHSSSVWSVSFSPNGYFLASGSGDNTVRLWEVETGQQIWVLEGHRNSVRSVSFSPDGYLLASGSRDGTIRLWEVETGQQTGTLEVHNTVRSVSFSPDGYLLASGSRDGAVRLWEVKTGKQVKVLEGHGSIRSVSFSPDGRLLASALDHTTICLWEMGTGRQIGTLDGHGNWVWSVSFSPGGRFLASGSWDKALRLWDVSALDVGPEHKPERRILGILRPMQAHLLTLPLAHTIPPTPSRPAAWLRTAGAVGMHPPLCLAQDIGTLLTQPRDRLILTRPEHLPEDVDTNPYMSFLSRMAEHPILRQVSRWDISEAVTGVVLARLVEGVQFPEEYNIPAGAVTFARQLGMRLDEAEPAKLWHDTNPAQRTSLSALLPPEAMAQVEANLRKLDADELRFMHCYGPRFSGTPDPRELLDLFNLLQLPHVSRLALSQMLRLLPRVSETASVGGVQTYAMGGYEGITRKGDLDSLILTELAYPREVLLHRLLNQEALYYGREGEREQRHELAYIITQAGIEMKGDGGLLARALTLALGQTMQHRGYEVQQSFVGSEWTKPVGLEKPVDVHRVLYYHDKGWLHPGEMLESVLGQVRLWVDAYRGMQLFWVMSEHWDADYWRDHAELYHSLKQRAGQQAWFIRVGSMGDGDPVTCDHFHRYELLSTEMIWEER